MRNVVDQVCWGSKAIKGFMLESNINEGGQKITNGKSGLKYGVSVTDPCIGWEETERIMLHAASMLRSAREKGWHEEIL